MKKLALYMVAVASVFVAGLQAEQKSVMQQYQDFYNNPNKTQQQVQNWSNYWNN
jgi:hypothetical protein